jgi:histidine ammonia-lyase
LDRTLQGVILNNKKERAGTHDGPAAPRDWSSNVTELTLKPGTLTLAQLRAIHAAPVRLQLDASAAPAIDASVACVEQIIAEDRTAYGINTGFGLLASTRIASDDLENLQRSLVLSHAAGVGAPLDDDLVRLIMVLKINSLSRGFSGIRRKVIDALIALVNAEVYPHIPLKGSVGASGDLAPLAHMSLVLLGEGKARYKGQWLSATEAWRCRPRAADPGCQRRPGPAQRHPGVHRLCLRGLFQAEDLYAAAIACGGLSVEAALGSRSPFDARIHEVRGQRGQIDTAACFRDLLGDPAKCRCRTRTATRCRTRTRCAASRRSWAPA